MRTLPPIRLLITVVEGGETGYLVRQGDVSGLAETFAELATSPQVMAGMGAAGRQRVRDRFSAEATAEQVGTIIEGVLRRQNR